ncbi:MAG: cytochrome c oxidase subunit 3 family protein [Pseudomonadota bacterium]|nr:cytochrome c oxidase subunit 3 family protein [Pseudomonadota bacterium]
MRAQDREALPGDLAIWIFIFAELLVFGILFAVYAFARSAHVALFNQGQALLDRRLGLANTLVLITSSYAVARATEAIHRDRVQACGRWLLAALLLGSLFVGIKCHEFARDAQAGMNLSHDLFQMFYLSLTGFHFLHVVMGMAILAAVAAKTFAGGYRAHDCTGVETAGAWWHMVDLVWIILFILVYVLR